MVSHLYQRDIAGMVPQLIIYIGTELDQVKD